MIPNQAHIYTITRLAFSLSEDQDIISITNADDRILIPLYAEVSQEASVASVQVGIRLAEWSTVGSVGAASGYKIRKHHKSSPDFPLTVRTGDTTLATVLDNVTAGSVQHGVIAQSGCNLAGGWIYRPTPEEIDSALRGDTFGLALTMYAPATITAVTATARLVVALI